MAAPIKRRANPELIASASDSDDEDPFDRIFKMPATTVIRSTSRHPQVNFKDSKLPVLASDSDDEDPFDRFHNMPYTSVDGLNVSHPQVEKVFVPERRTPRKAPGSSIIEANKKRSTQGITEFKKNRKTKRKKWNGKIEELFPALKKKQKLVFVKDIFGRTSFDLISEEVDIKLNSKPKRVKSYSSMLVIPEKCDIEQMRDISDVSSPDLSSPNYRPANIIISHDEYQMEDVKDEIIPERRSSIRTIKSSGVQVLQDIRVKDDQGPSFAIRSVSPSRALGLHDQDKVDKVGSLFSLRKMSLRPPKTLKFPEQGKREHIRDSQPSVLSLTRKVCPSEQNKMENRFSKELFAPTGDIRVKDDQGPSIEIRSVSPSRALGLHDQDKVDKVGSSFSIKKTCPRPPTTLKFPEQGRREHMRDRQPSVLSLTRKVCPSEQNKMENRFSKELLAPTGELSSPSSPEFGFENPDGHNKCWMNSSLQILLSMKTFVEDILHCVDEHKKTSKYVKCSDLLEKFNDIIKAKKRSNKADLQSAANSFYEILIETFTGFKNHAQEDVAEFFGHFFSALNSEFNENGGENPVNENICFRLREVVTCGKCSSPHCNEFLNYILMVDVPPSKVNCRPTLQIAIENSLVEKDRSVNCQQCGYEESDVRTIFITIPRYLIVQLKRFSFDYNTKTSSKISDKIEINNRISLQRLCVSEVINSDQAEYSLLGVITHLGDFGGGHYVAEVFNTDSQEWVHYNDKVVTRSSLNDHNKECQRNGYMFVYKKNQE